MRFLLWTLLAIFCIAVLLAGWVAYQFRKYRREVPKPIYKRPERSPDLSTWTDDGLYVSWVGHSTLYIRWNGIGILTDPVFSDRIGVKILGLWTVGPKRHTAPALQLQDIKGKVDLVLLSHAHMDHFDLPTLKRVLAKDVEVVTAIGTGKLVKGAGYVRELGQSDSLVTRTGIRITAVPVRHWGARFPWNKDYQWTGYLLELDGQRLFYAGDTAYTPSLGDLRKYGEIDVVFMPIGAYAPDSFQGAHCTPEQAWQMFKDIGGKYLVPIHWDTFVLSQEPVDEPMQRLKAAAGPEAEMIVIRKHGDVFQRLRATVATNESQRG